MYQGTGCTSVLLLFIGSNMLCKCTLPENVSNNLTKHTALAEVRKHHRRKFSDCHAPDPLQLAEDNYAVSFHPCWSAGIRYDREHGKHTRPLGHSTERWPRRPQRRQGSLDSLLETPRIAEITPMLGSGPPAMRKGNCCAGARSCPTGHSAALWPGSPQLKHAGPALLPDVQNCIHTMSDSMHTFATPLPTFCIHDHSIVHKL
jgi:hypothetical protein